MTPSTALLAVAERAKCRHHVEDYADVLAEEVRRLMAELAGLKQKAMEAGDV